MLNKPDKWLEFITAATPDISEYTRKFLGKQVKIIHDTGKSTDNRLKAAENVVFLLTGHVRTRYVDNTKEITDA